MTARKVHIPETPEGVMLPGAFLPVVTEECAGSFAFMTRLGIERGEAQERYCRHFCDDGCHPVCQQIMISKRAKHVPGDRIPLFITKSYTGWEGGPVYGREIARIQWRIPESLLRRSVYLEEE